VIARREIPSETRAQQNIFVSMTDLTVSILLVVVILMAFMATQMRDTRLLGDLEALRGLLGDAEAQLAERERERESQAGALAQIGSELALSEATRRGLAGELASLRQDLHDKNAEAERLEGALLAATRDGETLRATLWGELEASRAAESDARSELERAERRAQALAGELDALAREYEARGAEIEGLANLNADLEAELDRRAAEGLEMADLRAHEFERLTAQLGALRADLGESARELKEARDKLNAEAVASKALRLELAGREEALDDAARRLQLSEDELKMRVAEARAAQSAHSEEREKLLGEAARLERELGAEGRQTQRRGDAGGDACGPRGRVA
jgi:chromosome segregation ATPase